MLHAGFLPEVGDPGRTAMLDTLAQAAAARRREGDHARLRDRPGDRRPAPPDARRPEGAQPQGQLRPGQHAPLRHGRPDPRRRDPRPRHPQRPRQGRPAADHPRPMGRGSPAGRGRGRHPPVRPDPEAASATPARSSSSARSATRPAGSATSRTAWRSSANAWPTESPAVRGPLLNRLGICIDSLVDGSRPWRCLRVAATFSIRGGEPMSRKPA